jgi:predicted kinase
MPTIVILRGHSGAGKTTMAKREYPDHVLCEADQFFEKDGEYKFDRSKLKQAHLWCQEKALSALKEGRDVVVANTFIRRWEIEPYISMGYPFSIITVEGSYKNIHNVPQNVVDLMRARFEHFDVDDLGAEPAREDLQPD